MGRNDLKIEWRPIFKIYLKIHKINERSSELAQPFFILFYLFFFQLIFIFIYYLKMKKSGIDFVLQFCKLRAALFWSWLNRTNVEWMASSDLSFRHGYDGRLRKIQSFLAHFARRKWEPQRIQVKKEKFQNQVKTKTIFLYQC